MLEAKSEITMIREGQSFVLLPERAAFWKEEKVLFCSDLHWGRERYLQTSGFAVPEVSFAAEARILSDLVKKWGAREVWVLGDFIHHPRGIEAPFRAQIREWVKGLGIDRVLLIPGNHDRGAAQWATDCGVALAPASGVDRNGISFRHEEANSAAAFTWYGHLHPAVRVPEVAGHRKLPCFFVRKKEAFLPAFSRLAGGAEIGRTSVPDEVYVIHDSLIFQNPVGADLP